MFHHKESHVEASIKKPTEDQDVSLKQCLDASCKGILIKPTDVAGHKLPSLEITDNGGKKQSAPLHPLNDKTASEKPGMTGKPVAPTYSEKPRFALAPGHLVKPTNPVWDKPGAMLVKPAQEIVIKPKPGTPGYTKDGGEKTVEGSLGGDKVVVKKPGNFSPEMQPVSKEEWAKLLAMKLAEIQREKEAGIVPGGTKPGDKVPDKVTEKPHAHKTPKTEKVEEKN